MHELPDALGRNMCNSGSIAYMFQRMGVFRLAPEGLDLEALELGPICKVVQACPPLKSP